MIVTYHVYGRFRKRYSPFKGFTGLMVRGLLGYSLKNLVCMKSEVKACIECEYYGKCIYSKMMETTSRVKPSAKIAKKGGLAGITKPYTVTPLRIHGINLSFSVNLFGLEMISNEPLIILALLDMGCHGLGVDSTLRERRKFTVEKIVMTRPKEEAKRIVYTFEDGYRYAHITQYYKDILEPFEYSARRIVYEKPKSVIISFKTPVRVTRRHEVMKEIPMEAIVMNLARKYSLLCEYYNVGNPLKVEEARALRDLVRENVKLVNSRYRVVRLHRYSIDWKKRQSLGEFVKGNYTYSIEREFWKDYEALLMIKLLLLGKYTHVGTFASAGCGCYDIYWGV